MKIFGKEISYMGIMPPPHSGIYRLEFACLNSEDIVKIEKALTETTRGSELTIRTGLHQIIKNLIELAEEQEIIQGSPNVRSLEEYRHEKYGVIGSPVNSGGGRGGGGAQ